MWQKIKQFKNANRQTKIFVFMGAIYMIAMIWTTAQAYARLGYSRSDHTPIVIQTPHQS